VKRVKKRAKILR